MKKYENTRHKWVQLSNVWDRLAMTFAWIELDPSSSRGYLQNNSNFEQLIGVYDGQIVNDA